MNTTEIKIGDNQVVISKGTRHVSLMTGNGKVIALAYSGSEHFPLSDCYSRKEFKSEAGARKWATTQLR